jgi:pantothenate kinase type III
MLLAIDVGNTNSKFAVFDGDKLVAQFRLRTEAKRTADEYAAWADPADAAAGLRPGSINGAILASVVPPVNMHSAPLCETYFKTAAGRRRARLPARHQGADRPAAGRRRRPAGRRDRGLSRNTAGR